MSREGRMLLVLAIFGIAGVAALGVMAHRYGSILERQQESKQFSERRVAGAGTKPEVMRPRKEEYLPPRTAPATPDRSPADEARRYVDAFIEVRRALRAPTDSSDGEAAALDRALAEAGIDRAEYRKIERIYQSWRAGNEDLGAEFVAELVRRKNELE